MRMKPKVQDMKYTPQYLLWVLEVWLQLWGMYCNRDNKVCFHGADKSAADQQERGAIP